MIPTEFKDKKEFLDAFKIATQHTWNKEELEIYEYVALKEVDEQNALHTAEKKGELKAKIEIAKNSLKEGLDIKTIQLITGLDEKEILKLKEEK